MSPRHYDDLYSDSLLPGAVVASVEITPEALALLLQDTTRLKSVTYEKFKRLAKQNRCGIPVLGVNDMPAMVSSLAKEFNVPEKAFGDMQQMFWRFDFTGDGSLDANEMLNLCTSVLRSYQDAISPPRPGVVRLGGKIPMLELELKYTVSKKLGQGGQGAVYLAEDKLSKQVVVVKFYDKSCPNAPVDEITREFELMMKLKHPKIAHYFDIFQDKANIYVTTEPYFGGDLSGAVLKASQAGARVNEVWQANIMKQVVQGMQFLHLNEIMHCDLKEANVMVARDQNWHDPEIVVIDFGLAYSFACCKTRASGTPGYMPPEVWECGLWTPRGDVFTLGVMLFKMRAGQGPFTIGCKDISDVKRRTMEKEVALEVGSSALKKLTNACLTKKLPARPSMRDVSQHPWMAGKPTESILGQEIGADIIHSIEKQERTTALQRALLADFASRRNLADLRQLNRLFVELDVDLNGYLTADEVRAAQGEITDRIGRESMDILSKVIQHSGGALSYEEFIGKLMVAKEPEENRILSQIFHEYDRDSKGYLDLRDIEELLKRPVIGRILGRRDAATVLQGMDVDGNGRIQFSEFRNALQGSSPSPALNCRDLKKGQKILYYSTSIGKWILCSITEVDARAGAVQVEAKPGFWFKGAEIAKRLKLPPPG